MFWILIQNQISVGTQLRFCWSVSWLQIRTRIQKYCITCISPSPSCCGKQHLYMHFCELIIYELCPTKGKNWHVRLSKTLVSLRFFEVLSESLMDALWVDESRTFFSGGKLKFWLDCMDSHFITYMSIPTCTLFSIQAHIVYIALQFQDYAVLQITTCLILKIVLTVSVLTFNRKTQGTLTFYKCMY